MLKDIVKAAPVSSIDDVLWIMTAIDSNQPDSGGVKWFNHLYLQVTRGVQRAVTGPAFRDTRFMSGLDVVFANLYFAAIAAGDMDPSSAPSAWRPLFRARRNGGIARLQFALAGMHAHQSRPPSRHRSGFQCSRGDPTSDEVRRHDFDSMNELLERVEGEVKADFSVGVIGVVDVAAGRVDDRGDVQRACSRSSSMDERPGAMDAPACAVDSQRILRHTRQVHRTSWAWFPHPNGDRHSFYVRGSVEGFPLLQSDGNVTFWEQRSSKQCPIHAESGIPRRQTTLFGVQTNKK